MIVYFSATGNSRYCAKILSDLLDDKCIDIFNFIRDKIAADFISEKPWDFVCPTHAWRMPGIFFKAIVNGEFTHNKNAYFVMTCGGDIGNASEKNLELCEKKSFNYLGTARVIMPDNYIVMFNPPDKKEALEIISRAHTEIRKIAECIGSEKALPAINGNVLDILKSGIVNSLFSRFATKAKPFFATDRCISCGKCQEVCPTRNIKILKGKPVWDNNCTHCMACISSCPVSAIEYGKSSRGRTRYLCPEYKGL